MTQLTNSYIIIGNKPHRLSEWNNVLVFLFNGNAVWYDELRDGPVVTEAEVKERYPEWLV